MDIHADGVGCALARLDAETVWGRGGVFTRQEVLQKGHFHRKHSVPPVVRRGPCWQDPPTLGRSLVVHWWYSGPTCRHGKTGGETHGVAAGRGGGGGQAQSCGGIMVPCRRRERCGVCGILPMQAAGWHGEQCSGKQGLQISALRKTRLCRGQRRAWMHHLSFLEAVAPVSWPLEWATV